MATEMTVDTIMDVEFGAELEPFAPDTSLAATGAFADAVGWGGGGRFKDHEQARREGLPGALVPGIMAMGFLSSMIHRWAPAARIDYVEVVNADSLRSIPRIDDRALIAVAVFFGKTRLIDNILL